MRLRYRLEMSDNLSAVESQALNRDISQLEALIEELLTYARLDRPQNELHLSEPDLPLWLSTHLADIQAVTPDKNGTDKNARARPLCCVGYALNGARAG